MTTPRRLAARIRPDPGVQFNTFRPAVVVTVNDDGTVDLDVPAAPTAFVLDSCVVAAGDVVFYATSAAAPIVVGVARDEPASESPTIIAGAGGWSNYGGAWEPLTVTLSGGICTMTGLVASSTTVALALYKIADLADRFWPADDHMFHGVTDTGLIRRFDVTAAGEVRVFNDVAVGWLAVNASWPIG